MAEPLLVIDLEAPFAGYESVEEWFMGEWVDHVYATCPILTRGGRPPKRGQGRLYPEAGDCCGLCLRWWRARKAKSSGLPPETPALPEEETTDG